MGNTHSDQENSSDFTEIHNIIKNFVKDSSDHGGAGGGGC